MEVRVHVASPTVWSKDFGRVLSVEILGIALKDCGKVDEAKPKVVFGHGLP